MPDDLLRVAGLTVTFPAKHRHRPARRILDGITFDIRPAETLGLVGESGSGKSTAGRAILGLVRPSGGTITFDGHDITHARRKQRLTANIDIQAVFQDPFTSLNPTMTAGDTLAEPLRAHGMERAAADRRVAELFDRIHLPPDAATRLPREFSGGQRQRIAIARALAPRPRLIVCDEPVSALDTSTQSTVLDLFIELQETLGIAYLFISHDLDVIRHISHRVAVLRHGTIAELGDAQTITTTPQHPYTRRLLLASPVTDPDQQAERRRQLHELTAAQPHPT